MRNLALWIQLTSRIHLWGVLHVIYETCKPTQSIQVNWLLGYFISLLEKTVGWSKINIRYLVIDPTLYT